MSRAAGNGVRASGCWRRVASSGVGATAVALILASVAGPAVAAAADPGTHIDNVATLRFTVAGADHLVQSNVASIVVAERLDLTLVRIGTGPVANDAHATIAATLTNSGSGHEAFSVAALVAGNAVPGAIVAIDTDGDGRYDPTHDTLLTAGQTPMLAPGASIALVIVADTGAAGTGALTIGAKALTASGAPGTVAAGAGDNGGDAVVGPTGAAASFSVSIVDSAAAPTLTKSQVIRAPDGSDKPVSGAVVTYTLEATFGSATAGVRIADPVPVGTRYVAGSLTLDGAPLSDATDGDAGQADGATIAVTLGTIPAAASHRVQFQVQIP